MRRTESPESLSNRPFYDLSSDGKLSIQSDSGRKVGQVLTLRVKISVGNIVKEVNFRIGEITIEKNVQTSTYQYQGLEYHNLLNGGLINLQSDIIGTSTLKEGNLDFNYYFADKSTFVYLDANSNPYTYSFPNMTNNLNFAALTLSFTFHFTSTAIHIFLNH